MKGQPELPDIPPVPKPDVVAMQQEIKELRQEVKDLEADLLKCNQALREIATRLEDHLQMKLFEKGKQA